MFRKSNLKKDRREVEREGGKVKAGLMNGRRAYIRAVVHSSQQMAPSCAEKQDHQISFYFFFSHEEEDVAEWKQSKR